MPVRLAFAAALLLSAAAPATAQPSAAKRDACIGDFQKFCAAVKPGGGRVLACLLGNADKLSPDCLAVLPPANPK